MIVFKPFKSTYLLLFFIFNIQLISVAQNIKPIFKNNLKQNAKLKTGAQRTALYVPFLKNKKIAVVSNHTSVIYSTKDSIFEVFPGENEVYFDDIRHHNTHLVDSLLSLDLSIKKVFAPEHGFRGKIDAGEVVKDGFDAKTGLPIISLYGKNKKPSAKQLDQIDIVVFDIQDVGTRFYTYISTLHYVLEACAEAGIPVLILDRPNPNGHYIDGPVLELEYKSFVGMHQVPVVYGMTIGEYGKMINGERWLKNGIQCDLKVIPLANYSHSLSVSLPIKPSPNLPNDSSINLYPSLCFFEGTNVSVGRGTEMQFQVYGSPFLKQGDFMFTPTPNEGAKYPKHNAKICFGEDLRTKETLHQLDLSYLISAYKQNTAKEFFNDFFTKLAGTKKIQQQIEQGLSVNEIKNSWKEDLQKFRIVREKYLLYK
ncbi:MAG: DUF1343 domain-containing protein [Polaribacter sp.]|nr:DUF1343 domain-containing protein [Polaribacter sp.]